MTGLFQIIFECLSFQVCLAMLPSFLQFMLSLKSCELSGPELGLGHDCRGGGVAVCGHVSVPGIELSMVGEEVVIFDSLVTHLARPAGVVVVGDPIDSTSGLRGAERLARNCSLSEFLTFMNIDLRDFKLFRGGLPGDRSCICKFDESYFNTRSTSDRKYSILARHSTQN